MEAASAGGNGWEQPGEQGADLRHISNGLLPQLLVLRCALAQPFSIASLKSNSMKAIK